MKKRHPRIERESKTLGVMLAIYCRGVHHRRELCRECSDLLVYARERLDKCPFQAGKTTCAKCPVHCYQPSMRENIRRVMRYAGPRITFYAPHLAFYHIIDSRRKKPVKPDRT